MDSSNSALPYTAPIPVGTEYLVPGKHTPITINALATSTCKCENGLSGDPANTSANTMGHGRLYPAPRVTVTDVRWITCVNATSLVREFSQF